jgi:hypothetical protein
MRAMFGFTVCVRDDDARTFEFCLMSDTRELTDRVAAAIKKGRAVRCYVLAKGATACELEERYLVSEGYRWAIVDV